MLQKFKNHIDQNFPFLKDKKLLIAISGGLDSVVLTHLIVTLSGVEVSLAHCNFQLRENESDLDEEFVKKVATKLSVSIFTISFETNKFAIKNKQSTQIAARNLRYNWFKELIEKHEFDYVLTAHHADDNLETFLINLTRGSGLDGFTGIPEINGKIVRPLLVFSREEIMIFAKENTINWREDVSNASTKYIRNKIRHQVVPILKEINSGLLETFGKTIEHLQESQQIITDKMEDVSSDILSFGEGSIKMDIQKIQQVSNPKAYLYQLLKSYDFTQWTDVYTLLSAQSGKQVFSKTHRLVKDRDFLLLTKIKNKLDVLNSENYFLIEEGISEITQPIHLTLEEVSEISSENKQTIYVSKECLHFPLILRKWQNGDSFYPTGMKGKKKLSKYFKDDKLSLLEKEETWLLCNNDTTIIWVVGRRLDRKFRVTKNAGFQKITVK